jgi:thermitase
MSFGLPRIGGGLPHREIVPYGLRRRVVMVAAAGNDGQRQLYDPGSLPGVLADEATDPDDRVAVFSTFGPQVTLTAPGTDIYSSYRDGGYAFASGTSQAGPFVAGAAALLQSAALEQGRRLDVPEIRRNLVRTADRPDALPRSQRSGYGRLNIADEVRLVDVEVSRTRPTTRHVEHAERTGR